MKSGLIYTFTILIGLAIALVIPLRTYTQVNQSGGPQSPTVMLEKKFLKSMKVLVITDTVLAVTDIQHRIGQLYQDLFVFASRAHLKSGKVMAFYLTETSPFTVKKVIPEYLIMPAISL